MDLEEEITHLFRYFFFFFKFEKKNTHTHTTNQGSKYNQNTYRNTG